MFRTQTVPPLDENRTGSHRFEYDHGSFRDYSHCLVLRDNESRAENFLKSIEITYEKSSLG
jgi:hypothetical protein